MPHECDLDIAIPYDFSYLFVGSTGLTRFLHRKGLFLEADPRYSTSIILRLFVKQTPIQLVIICNNQIQVEYETDSLKMNSTNIL
jgi:hypothetical protein